MEAEFVEIRDAARRALTGSVNTEALKAADVVSPDLVERVWDAAIAAGWPCLMVSEDAGGVGLGLSVAILVAEEIGRASAPGPWGPTLALAPALDLDAATLEALAGGEIRIALALCDVEDDRLVALVDHARSATHHLLVWSSRTLGPQARLVPASAALSIVDRRPLDPATPLAAVQWPRDVDGVALTVSMRAFDALRCFVAAEMIGAARAALALALDHAGTRMQFGVKIGSFQAIKHRLADVSIAVDSAALAIDHAARAFDAGDPDATIDVAAAYALATRAAQEACNAAIQIHGAIGVSWEHDLHLHLKRVRALASATAHHAIPRISIAAHLEEVVRKAG